MVFLYFNEDAFTHKENVPAVFLMLMLYAWAIIPFIYLTSFCFDSAGNACVKLIIMLTFLSIGPFVLVSVTSEKGEARQVYTSHSFNHPSGSHTSRACESMCLQGPA